MMHPLAGVPSGSRRDVIDGPPYLGTDRTWAYLNETTPRYTHTPTSAVRPSSLPWVLMVTDTRDTRELDY